MKKALAIVIAFLMFTLAAFADVSEKLVHSFNEAFPSAQNVKWSKDAEGYFVSFTQLGIFSKAAYNLRGDFVYALRYYKEENLPASIVLAVRKKFANKIIFGVTELSTSHDVTYHLCLKDEKKWYNIIVTTIGKIKTEKLANLSY